MEVDKSKWERISIGQCCIIQNGTRIVKKDTEEGPYFVYGGGGATFTTTSYNRENALVISRFAMSNKCTRYINGKFFLNDSGLSLIPKDDNILFGYLKWNIFALNDKIYELGKGVAQKNLDMNRFPLLLLNIPPKKEQEAITKELNAVETIIDEYKAQIRDFDELTQSIFNKIFGDISINDKKWHIMPLGKIGNFKNGLNYEKGLKGRVFKFIGVGDFQDNKYLSSSDTLSTIELESISEEYLLKNEDIVFVRSNGNKNLVGRCLEVFPNETEMTYSGFCIRFRKTAEIINKYLLGVLTDSTFKKIHILKSNGIGIQNINQKLLSNLPIPLPPIELQKKYECQVDSINNQKKLILEQLKDAEQLMAERMQYYFS